MTKAKPKASSGKSRYPRRAPKDRYTSPSAVQSRLNTKIKIQGLVTRIEALELYIFGSTLTSETAKLAALELGSGEGKGD